jgi:integrase
MERTVTILPFARPILARYLARRAENVAKYAPSNDALFPALHDKRDGIYSSQQQRLLKKVVEEETRTRFELRACRRTFGQICIDKGAQIEAVSLMLGHSSTKTTESYYYRKREDVALKEIFQLWKVKNTPSAKNVLIENEKYLSGYA